jgi:dihydrofolate reductase
MKSPRLVLIAAVSRNGVLALGGKIPWHLPRDVAHFRARTAGRWLLLGRTTYEQMTGWFQPGHVPVVLTRQIGYAVQGGWVVSSVREAMALAARQGVDELVVCGGGQVYAAALPEADEIILTKVDTEVSGDAFFPTMTTEDWRVMEEDSFPADESNAVAMRIIRYGRTGLRLPDGREGR